MDEIAENRRAKLEVEGPKVRIVADKESAIHALEDINRLWLLRHVKHFSLIMPNSRSAVLPGNSKKMRTALLAFRPEDVALASSLTRTTMTYANNSKRTVSI